MEYIKWINNNILRYRQIQRRMPGALSSRERETPTAKYAQRVFVPWTWGASWKRDTSALSSCERNMTHLLMGTYDFEADGEGRPAFCWDVNVRRPTSWWEHLSLTEMVSVKRTTTHSYLMRGRWKTYGR